MGKLHELPPPPALSPLCVNKSECVGKYIEFLFRVEVGHMNIYYLFTYDSNNLLSPMRFSFVLYSTFFAFDNI